MLFELQIDDNRDLFNNERMPKPRNEIIAIITNIVNWNYCKLKLLKLLQIKILAIIANWNYCNYGIAILKFLIKIHNLMQYSWARNQ